MLTGCRAATAAAGRTTSARRSAGPITGWTRPWRTRWTGPGRRGTMIGTAYWYMHTDQWRYDGYRADALASPLAEGHLAGMHTADTIAQSARLGWMPFYPQFDRNPLDLADEARAAGPDEPGRSTSSTRLTRRQPEAPPRTRRAGELAARPRAVARQPARLLGEGQRVLPASTCWAPTTTSLGRRDPAAADGRATCAGTSEAPEGKLDLLVSPTSG